MTDPYRYTGDSVIQARMRDDFLKRCMSKVTSDGPNPRNLNVEFLEKQISEGMIVLDMGTGTGHVPVKLLEDLGCSLTVVGLEISLGMIEAAVNNLRRFKGGVLVRGDCYRLPCRSCSVDIAASRLAPYEGGEVYRVLREGGYLFVVGTGLDDWREVKEEFDQLPESKIDHASALREAGFRDVCETVYDYREYYPFDAMVDVIEFVPIVEGFDRERHVDRVKALAGELSSEKGVRITRQVRIISARKPD